MIKKIDNFMYRLSAIVGALSFVLIIAIMLLNLVDVIFTKTIKLNFQGTYELTERMLMCTIFASLAYGEVNDAHIHTTLFVARLPRVLRFFLFGLMSLLSTATCVLWCYALFVQFGEDMRKNTITAVLKIPIYPFVIFAFICMIVFTLVIGWHMVKAFMAIRNDQCAEEVSASWA